MKEKDKLVLESMRVSMAIALSGEFLRIAMVETDPVKKEADIQMARECTENILHTIVYVKSK